MFVPSCSPFSCPSHCPILFVASSYSHSVAHLTAPSCCLILLSCPSRFNISLPIQLPISFQHLAPHSVAYLVSTSSSPFSCPSCCPYLAPHSVDQILYDISSVIAVPNPDSRHKVLQYFVFYFFPSFSAFLISLFLRWRSIDPTVSMILFHYLWFCLVSLVLFIIFGLFDFFGFFLLCIIFYFVMLVRSSHTRGILLVRPKQDGDIADLSRPPSPYRRADQFCRRWRPLPRPRPLLLASLQPIGPQIEPGQMDWYHISMRSQPE